MYGIIYKKILDNNSQSVSAIEFFRGEISETRAFTRKLNVGKDYTPRSLRCTRGAKLKGNRK